MPSAKLAVLAALFVLIPGCSLAPPEAPGAEWYSIQSGFSNENPIFFFRFFNLTTASEVRYAFDVGDGGTAHACFVAGDDLDTWKSLQYPLPPNAEFSYTSPEVWACSERVETGSAKVLLEAGSYVLAINGRDCPMKDCRLRINHGGFQGGNMGFMNATAPEGWPQTG